jgi:hypothetical protein
MPSPRRIVIRAFQKLLDPVEILALGQVRRQPGRAVEGAIEVLLASRVGGGEFDPQKDLHRKWVSCGQIDLLTVGSQWERGLQIGDVGSEKYSGAFAHEESGPEYLGIGAVEPVGNARAFPSEPFAAAPGFLLVRRGRQEQDGVGPRKLLLPQIELARALFGVSSRFLVQLFDGVRHPSVPDRGILDRKRSELTDKVVNLFCWRRPGEEEALILAAMVADKAIMRFHDEVFQSLSVQKGYRNDRPTWPQISWPFQRPIEMSVEGRWIERRDGFRRFLVTRITAMKLELPFHRIKIYYVGAEGPRPGRLPPPKGRTRKPNARTKVLTLGKPSSWSRRPAEIASPSLDIATEQIVLEYIPSGGTHRPPTSTIGEDPREEGEFSTAGRERGADRNVGRAEIRRKAGGDPEEALAMKQKALRQTWRAIRKAAAADGWRCTPHPVSGGGDVSTPDGGFDFREEGILVGLEGRGRYIVIADDGSAEGDRRSLGILVPREARPISARDLATIRGADKLHGGRWGSAEIRIDGFRIYAVRRHPEVWGEDSADYIKLLVRNIRRAI